MTDDPNLVTHEEKTFSSYQACKVSHYGIACNEATDHECNVVVYRKLETIRK